MSDFVGEGQVWRRYEKEGDVERGGGRGGETGEKRNVGGRRRGEGGGTERWRVEKSVTICSCSNIVDQYVKIAHKVKGQVVAIKRNIITLLSCPSHVHIKHVNQIIIHVYAYMYTHDLYFVLRIVKACIVCMYYSVWSVAMVTATKKAAWQQLAMLSHEWSPLPSAVEASAPPRHLGLQVTVGARGIMRESSCIT